MASRRRAEPLRATPREPGSAPRSGLRSVLLGAGVGLAVLVAGVAVAYSVVAIPLYLVASTDPGQGLDRDLVRQGLVYVALPFGLISGIAGGVVVGVWYGRGGRLPRHHDGIYSE